MQGNSSFDLAGSSFAVLPKFIQAHFTEAPRLDNSRIEKRRFKWPNLTRVDVYFKGDSDPSARWQALKTRVKAYFEGDPDRTARWQALKRPAIQGHDHVSEQLFFKGELKSRRWSTDMPWHATFWFGWFYQALSDFGRSLMRPLIWWGLGIIGFALIYLSLNQDFEGRRLASLGWAQERIISAVGVASLNTSMEVECVAAPQGDPLWAALDLSLRKGLVVPGVGSSEKLNQNYRCLYGVEQEALPMIPYDVSILGLLQNLYSAALIFLFLLAVRNHFRIN